MPSGNKAIVMNFHGWGNSIEAVFWVVVGVIVFCRSRRESPAVRTVACVACAAFVLFGVSGVSDVIEIFTGAWYKPVGLLVFKAVCLTTLVACYVRYRRVRSPSTAESQQ
jgi:peptidoglycan/LPS O-acetylase OafA/YrhL